MEETRYRPADILAAFLGHYGYDTRRVSSPESPASCYALVERWDETEAQWVRRWKLVSTSHEGDKSLSDSVSELLGMTITQAQESKYPDLVAALVLLVHGKAKVAFARPGTGEPTDYDPNDPEMAKALAEYPEMRERVLAGETPVRMVEVVTPEGLASELTMFYPNEPEPWVETSEQWVEDGETVPTPRGIVQNALTDGFTYLMLIREVIQRGHEPTLDGLVACAMEMRENGSEGADQFTAFVFRLLASGIEGGFFSDDE